MGEKSLPGASSGPDRRGAHAVEARGVLLASLAITGILWIIPFGDLIGYPLLLVSTYVHEMGHGLAALLTGGSFAELQIDADGSGVAFTATGGRLARAAVSAGGLIGPAIAAAIGFTLGRRATWARIALILGGLFGLLTVLIWVRSLVGILVALGLSLASLAIGVLVRQPRWSQLWLVFLSVQLGLSVFSRSEYLFTSLSDLTNGQVQSDSESLAAALIGPYWFWGGVCGLLSLLALAYGAWIYLRTATADLSGT